MTNKPYSLTRAYSLICAVLCLLFAAIVTPAFGLGDPNQDSSNWEWKWEGDAYPLATGIMEVNWFSPGTPDHLTFEAATMSLSAGPPTYANIPATTAALWYKAPAASIPAVNFATGATIEWRFKNHYGTANSGQSFVEFGDGNRTLRPTFQYPGSNPTGLMKFNAGAANETSYAIGMASSVPGNDFRTFRFVCLGDNFSLYVDNNPVPALTGTTDIRPGEQAINNFRFGDKLMQTDFDYIRYTTTGAFPPPSLPAAAPSKYSHKWEGNFEGDELPYDGGNGWWSVSWFDSPAGQETQYEIDSTAFADLPYESVPGNPYGAKTENQRMNVNALVGALWYKAPNAETFDFSTGATLEWRFKCHYGTANSGQVFVEFGDGTNTLRATFQYPGSNPTGLMKFNAGAANETSYAIGMHSNVLGNGYHTFRFVCLGNDFSLYVDNNSVPALTGTTDTRPGEQAINNLRFGSKLMQVDFDYVRWTKAGAFPPPTDCELLWEGTIGGLAQDMNQDCSFDELDLIEWVAAWLDCNDPAGCP